MDSIFLQTELITKPPTESIKFLGWAISILIAVVIAMFTMYKKGQNRLTAVYEAQIAEHKESLRIATENNTKLIAEIKPVLEALVKVNDQLLNALQNDIRKPG